MVTNVSDLGEAQSPHFRTWCEANAPGQARPAGLSLWMQRPAEPQRLCVQRVFSYVPSSSPPPGYPPRLRLMRAPEGESHLIYVRSQESFCPRADVDFELRGEGVFLHGGHDVGVPVMPFLGQEWVGVVLQPGVLGSLVGRSADQMKNGCWDYSRLDPKGAERLLNALRACKTLEERRSTLSRHAFDTINRRFSTETRLHRAISEIHRRLGHLRIDTLAKELGVAVRTMERTFLRHMGMSPKSYARVVRMGEMLRRLEQPETWSELAQDLGFSDQSHMIAECQELLSCSPRQLPIGPVLQTSLVTWTIPIAEVEP